MKIRYKGITHERTEDAPFVGALICATDCKFNCKGCFNQKLKNERTITKSAEKIVSEIKENPFNEGIIFGGLEWSLQPQELLELASIASKENLKVMIYTGCTLLEFQTIIGKSCAKENGYLDMLEKEIHTENDNGIYAFIGGMILDTMIKTEYYIKCGKYDENNLAVDRNHFGVYLSSNNQTIYKFENDGGKY